MRVCNVMFSCLLFVVVVCFVVVFLLKFNGFVSFGVCFICFLALPLFVLFVSGCLILHDRCFTCLCVLSFFFLDCVLMFLWLLVLCGVVCCCFVWFVVVIVIVFCFGGVSLFWGALGCYVLLLVFCFCLLGWFWCACDCFCC